MKSLNLYKYILAVALAAVALSCVKEVAPELTVAPSSANVEVRGGKVSIDIKANNDWKVSCSENWVVLSSTSGGPGNVSVIADIGENTTYDERTATITVTSATLTSSIAIRQGCRGVIILGEHEYRVDNGEKTLTVFLQSNVAYVSDISTEWITEKEVKGLNSHTHIFHIERNEDYNSRTATVTFKDASTGASDAFTVVQEENKGVILSERTVNVGDSEGFFDVNLRANVNYTVEIVSGGNWLESKGTKGLNQYTESFAYKTNDTYDPRQATVVFRSKSPNLADTLTVTQCQKDGIILADKSFEVMPEGGVVPFEVKANVKHSVVIPDDVSWISLASTKGLESYSYDIVVAENDTYDARTAVVTVKADGSDLCDEMVITQRCYDFFEVSQTSFDLSSEAGSIEIAVRTNVGCNFKITEGSDWIERVETKGLETASFTFAISGNEGYDSRTGTIVFSSDSGQRCEVSIRQAEKQALILTETQVGVGKEGGTVEVKIRANVKYSFSIPEDVIWIKEIVTKGLSEYSHSFSVEENGTAAVRTVRIPFASEDGCLRDTLTVSQEPETYLDLDIDHAEVPFSQSVVRVQVSSNEHHSFIIDDTCKEWVQMTSSSVKDETTQYVFSITPNFGTEPRAGSVTFRTEDGTQERIFTIAQAAPHYLCITVTGPCNFDVPILNGPGIGNSVVFWGDNDSDPGTAYSKNLSHRYGAGTYECRIISNNIDSFSKSGLSIIELFDLSEF